MSTQANPYWRSIKSAPKDGTFVIVAGNSGYSSTPLRVAACCWDGEYKAWMTHSHDRFTDGGEPAALWMPMPFPAVNERAKRQEPSSDARAAPPSDEDWSTWIAHDHKADA